MQSYQAPNPYAPPQAPFAPPYGAAIPSGAPVSAHVEGKLLVAANGSALPAMCLKCGGSPQHWRSQKYQYTPPWAFFFFGWLGALIFSKRSAFQVPVCDQHQAEWKKWNLIAGLSWLPGALLWVVGALVSGADGGVGAILLLLGTVVFLVGLFTALILRNRKIVMPSRIDKTHSWLRGVHANVLHAVASGQGAPAPQPPQGYGVQGQPYAPYPGYPA
jgi:hypothetical protein